MENWIVLPYFISYLYFCLLGRHWKKEFILFTWNIKVILFTFFCIWYWSNNLSSQGWSDSFFQQNLRIIVINASNWPCRWDRVSRKHSKHHWPLHLQHHLWAWDDCCQRFHNLLSFSDGAFFDVEAPSGHRSLKDIEH